MTELLKYLILILALPALADPHLNKAVRQNTLQKTICDDAYLTRIQPAPAFYYGVNARQGFFLAPIVPVNIGGSHTNLINFRLMPVDMLPALNAETDHYRWLICIGRVDLRVAQTRFLVRVW